MVDKTFSKFIKHSRGIGYSHVNVDVSSEGRIKRQGLQGHVIKDTSQIVQVPGV
jgi:hypothetical protein